MTITLNGLIHEGNTPIAVPAFRINIALAGALTDVDNATALTTITRAFLDDLGADIRFVSLGKSSGRPAKLTAPTAAKMQKISALLDAGLDDGVGLRLYGHDDAPLGKPAVPFLSLHQMYPGLVIAELALDPDHPATTRIAACADQALRSAQVLVAYMGLGFFQSPLSGLADTYLPPAHQRFRTALMGQWPVSFHSFFWNALWDTKLGGYRAGLPDLGWRSYVGDPARKRLKPVPDDMAPDVVIDTNDRMTIVTAGPAPVWGDVNAGEDISAYRAAYDFLLPAFADRRVLRNCALGGIPSHDPARADVVDSYLDRFL